jgi:hypothetical protein
VVKRRRTRASASRLQYLMRMQCNLRGISMHMASCMKVVLYIHTRDMCMYEL